MRGRRRGDPLADALVGALAGAAAVWVMDRVDWLAYEHEGETARRRTKAVRPEGKDPAHLAASRANRALGRPLGPDGEDAAGLAVHYALGVVPGAVYGALRREVPAVTAGAGALFGLGLFVVEDEVMNPLTGLSAGPGAYPWQEHARGLVAHLVYGLVLDAGVRLADRLREG